MIAALTIDDEIIVGAAIVGRLIGRILGQQRERYHQIILLSARRMHRGVACLIIALALARAQRQGELAEAISAERQRRQSV